MEIKEELDFDDFRQMNDLELKYYSDDHISDCSEAYDWYDRYDWYNVCLEEDDQIVAFTDLFPVKDELYQKYRSGKYDDSQLSADDMVDIDNAEAGMYHLFLCTLLVDDAFRGKGAVRTMLRERVDFFDKCRERGMDFDLIFTDNVTPEGCGFSEKMGFGKIMETESGTSLYEMPYTQFKDKVTARK